MTTRNEPHTDIALPGDDAFETATRVFNLAAPARPTAAITTHDADQVRAALRYATRAGLNARIQTTGHASASARPMNGSVLIRTEQVEPVEVDVERRVARVPAGTRWGTVVEAASPHGLAAPHGSSPDVGVIGYLLRGGVSFYGRRVGLAANSVRAIEMVTADGKSRRVSASADPELFWALRGGGGGFGVVTAVEVGLFPAAKVITGIAFWPVEHAERLMRSWLAWTTTAPETATTSLRVMNLPSIPAIPPELRAGPVICVDGAVLAETEEDLPTARHHAADLLEPMRSVAEPLLDTWSPALPSAVTETHMDPSEPATVHGDHMLLSGLDDSGAEAFLGVTAEPSGSPLVSAELRQLGGALARSDPAGGALDHFDADFAYIGAGLQTADVTAEKITSRLENVRTALRPWNTGRTAPTFVESFRQPQGVLEPDTVRAVDRVRARVDPTGLLAGDIARNATARRDGP
ncbi:FAD binding domain-containing protein [Actinopolyspora lacussalsi subsp. righensis]|uniref:FAD binding domain-containing protein n=1 Tax=Actinopolyspora righensis TaxID=995060 RepID=A0A1I6XDD7_9ACTN|nr:FAD-binding protein [Actinopolyspora righensis]SFT36217.1 FAD binding domain-containing protein [Actinopolyspora righensis]